MKPLGRLELLVGEDPARVVAFGRDLTPELVERVRRSLPAARIVSITAGPAPAGAIAVSKAAAPFRLQLLGASTLIALQDFRKLRALALLVPARKRFVLHADALVPLAALDFAISEGQVLDRRLLDGRVQRGLTEGSRSLEHRLRRLSGETSGVANHYRHIEDRPVPKEPTKTISVVVPVYNRKAALRLTLAALIRQTYPQRLFEVIVADDGSSDHPETLVAELKDRLPISIVSQPDLGFRLAEVRNLGIRAAKGEVIALLDCDMIPVPDYLESIMSWFHRAEGDSIAVIGGRKFIDASRLSFEAITGDFAAVRTAPSVPAPAAIRSEKAKPDQDWREPIYRETHRLKDHPYGYRLASGGNLAFAKRDALGVGLFDPAFQKWGGEDLEFAFRLHRIGTYFIPEPRALAYHQDHPASAPREEDRKTTAELCRQKVPQGRRQKPGETFEVPKVSVIVPHGAASNTPRAIASALASSFADLEVVVIGAPTSAPADRRIEVRPAEASRELAMRAGFAAARGEYLLVLDPDEELRPGGLSMLVETLNGNPKVGSVFGELEIHDTAMGLLAHIGSHPLREPGLPFTAAHLIRARDLHRALRRGATDERGLARALADVAWVKRRPEVVAVDHVEVAKSSKTRASRLERLLGDTRRQAVASGKTALRPLLRSLAERL